MLAPSTVQEMAVQAKVVVQKAIATDKAVQAKGAVQIDTPETDWLPLYADDHPTGTGSEGLAVSPDRNQSSGL